MKHELMMMLLCAYLRKIIDPQETDLQTANGIASDLIKFKNFLENLDKSEIS